MKGFKGYLKVLLFILVCFVFQDISAQFSKTHYIPPIATTGSGPAAPQTQTCVAWGDAAPWRELS